MILRSEHMHHRLRRKLDWLADDERDEVISKINGPMPRGRGKLTYKSVPDYLDQKVVRGRNHIIFISYYATPHLMKKSKVLRDSGHCFTTLIACCIREDFEIFQWFDQAYEVDDYAELSGLMPTLAPKALSVSIATNLNVMGCVAVADRPDCRLVIDVSDLMNFLYPDPLHIGCRIEKKILLCCDAYTHRMPPVSIDEVRSSVGIDTPDFEIQSLPLRQVFCDDSSTAGNPHARIVFPVGIMPYKIAKERGQFNNIYTSMIEAITSQGLQLSIYVNQNARNMYWDEQEAYFALSREKSNFNFRRGVPFHRLPEIIKTADYGLLYENMLNSDYNPKHYQYNVATKIYSYLEAGLPILIHSRATTMRDMIIGNGLGIEFDIAELENMKAIIAGCDISALKENVRVYRDKNDMTTALPALFGAFDI